MSAPIPSEHALKDVDRDSVTSDDSDATDEEGWEDLEPDDETQPVIGLFSDKVYPDVRSMLKESKDKNGFDMRKIQKDLGVYMTDSTLYIGVYISLLQLCDSRVNGISKWNLANFSLSGSPDLDFLDTIKLVNYVRSSVKDGNMTPDVTSKEKFQDEVYLKPVLEDDALLYSLDDIEDEESGEAGGTQAERQVVELQEELERLQIQFSEYRLAVQKSLDDQLSREDDKLASTSGPSTSRASNKAEEIDSDYFSSYAYNGIHESMLKDTIRTDSYRDFVYDNKHIFKDKVVLDVGCGTGILSMFCAKAGARKVISVDNSNIIDRAKEIVYENGFGDVITCIRGKIEEVALPVKQVDIIISEWMGYGLLFEAMFDSVIYARDRYLAPDGLMAPSHATLRIAPLADPDLVTSHIGFWHDVYGFNMKSMLTGIYDEALVRTVPSSSMAGESELFVTLPLHTITVEELSFLKEFEVTLTQDVDSLDGWSIWFDIFFMPSRESTLPPNAIPSDLQKKGIVAFTTGPDGKETHWQQTICLIDHGKKKPTALKKGQTIKGMVRFQKRNVHSRSLDITIDYDAHVGEKGSQEWALQ